MNNHKLYTSLSHAIRELLIQTQWARLHPNLVSLLEDSLSEEEVISRLREQTGESFFWSTSTVPFPKMEGYTIAASDTHNTYEIISLQQWCPGLKILLRAGENNFLQALNPTDIDFLLSAQRMVSHWYLGKEYRHLSFPQQCFLERLHSDLHFIPRMINLTILHTRQARLHIQAPIGSLKLVHLHDCHIHFEVGPTKSMAEIHLYYCSNLRIQFPSSCLIVWHEEDNMGIYKYPF